MVKNPVANAGDIRDSGLILGSGRSPEEGMATHSSILAQRIPWTEEPSGLQSMGLQRIRYDERWSMHVIKTFSIAQGTLLHSVVTYIDIYG